MGATTAGLVWSAPQVSRQGITPPYAAAQSGPGLTVINFLLEGSQEVPPTGTAAMAVGILTLDPVAGTVRIQISNPANVQGPITAGHIHQAAAGANGGVVVALFGAQMIPIDLTVSATTTTIDAIIANPADYYVNVHTTPFPGGEIRGQLG